MYIGNVEIKGKAVLAPMAGVSDKAFRELCMGYGAAYAVTEMVSSKGLSFNSKKSAELMELSPNEFPCGIQIFGSEPNIMADAARFALRYKPQIIDINMGCPAHKIVSNGEGSALMKNEALAGKIIEAAVKKSKLPVTVKFRKGWDDEHINAVSFAKMAEQSGAKLITVHGRTKTQMYSGTADWDIIAQIKASVKIPVIGNGDIFSGQNAVDMLKYTGCDGVMVARGAEGNPFIFREIQSALRGEKYSAPTREMRITAAIEHAERLTKTRGSRAIIEMRKHVSWYLSGMRSSAALRGRVNGISSLDELKTLLNEYLEATRDGEN